MSAKNLGTVLDVFFGAGFEREAKIEGFRLDYYHPSRKLAFEYDGPQHYCDVGHIERDDRKDDSCRARGIVLKRWPYYFQLTKDVAKYFFGTAYSHAKYAEAVRLVYGASREQDILAPGLHRSTNTPANYVPRGLTRFFREIDDAPSSLKCQVVRSFQIYRRRLGPSREWLLGPEGDRKFSRFMRHQPRPEHLNYRYPYAESRGHKGR